MGRCRVNNLHPHDNRLCKCLTIRAHEPGLSSINEELVAKHMKSTRASLCAGGLTQCGSQSDCIISCMRNAVMARHYYVLQVVMQIERDSLLCIEALAVRLGNTCP